MPLPRQKALCITLGVMICLPVVGHAQSTRGRDDRRERTIRFSIERRDRMPDREVTMSVGAYRNEEKGTSYVRTTMAFPVGLRFLLSDRVSLRAEARFRFDQRRTGGEAVGVEQTGGLSVVF